MNKFEYKKLAQLAVRENAELECENKVLQRELALYEDAIYPTPPVPEPQTMTVTKAETIQELRNEGDTE